ncbi:TCOF protein, partial [Tachuris rubrigastra]|nr:TCOF protein [Tachuris rubrigastra]
MAAGGGRELLALIHQHLLRGGFARAARELQAQTGQKLLPSLSTSLEDIFTHWEKTPPNSRRRKLSDDEAAIPEKIRVPDPVSSSESSEKEEDEKEKAKAANAASLSLATNSAVTVESSEEDESSSEEETPAGKGAVAVTPAVVGGKAANSLHSPPKPTVPAGRAAALPAPDRTVPSNNKQQPNALAAAPAKAQKLPAPGKPRNATAATAKVGQSKAAVVSKAPEGSSSSSSSSSSSESEEEQETLTVKAPAPRAEPKQAAGAAESSSEESSEDTSSEEEEQLTTPAVQAKPAVKAAQFNAAPVKSAPAAPVSHKKNAVKQTALAPSQTKPTSTTVPGAAQPDDTSESSSSSDSEDEELPSVTQTKPPPKSSQAVPSPVKPAPAASPSVKASPAKTLPVSQGKPAPKTAVPKQAKTLLGRTAAPTKPAENVKPVESSDSSDSEEDLPVPISQKRLTEQLGSVPNLSQAAKAGPPEKAVGSTLKSQVSESGSSDSSDSEEEFPAEQRQPPQAVKTNSVPQPTNVKKAPASAPATAPPAEDSSNDSSEESDSEDEIVPPSQANATLPSGKKVKTAVPPVSRVSESSNTDSSEHNVLAGKNAQLSQATLPTQAEDTSDSSSSFDSDEEVPKQPPKTAGSVQKPGVTQPAHSSSSESSEEEEEAASQSLLTGYLGFSKAPAAPQAPKMVSPQPVGEVGPGKAAVTAVNPPAKAPLKAAPADSSSTDSSDSDTDDDQVAANHKAENNPPSGQEATEASKKEKVAGKTEPGHASLKPSLKKALAAKENDVGAKEVQVTAAPSHALLAVPQSGEPSSGSETEVTAAAKVPAVQTGEGLEVKKKKKKEKKEKKEKKKPSSTAHKPVKTSKSKDKENKKQKMSQKRKLAGEDGAVGQPKEKKRKGQANEEVPKKKKKKAD